MTENAADRLFICPCPCHADGGTPECFCTPECVRGEATPLDITSREAVVAWLVENDPQGCHADADATLEMGAPHTLESALACYRGVLALDDTDATV